MVEMKVVYEGAVVGVSFPNDDGSSRQEALAKMAPWAPVCQGKLRPFDYKGDPALAVFWTVCAGSALRGAEAQVGCLPAVEVRRVLELIETGVRSVPNGRSKVDLATVLFVSIGQAANGLYGTSIRVVIP